VCVRVCVRGRVCDGSDIRLDNKYQTANDGQKRKYLTCLLQISRKCRLLTLDPTLLAVETNDCHDDCLLERVLALSPASSLTTPLWPRYLDRTRQKHAERNHRAGAQRVDRERKEAEH
jgi:hypothetical protein